MADAPERIWARPPMHEGDMKVGFWMAPRQGLDGTEFIRADLVDELVKALEAQIRSHAMLCRAAGLTDQDHALGTSQARAALTRIKGDGK